MRAWSYYDIAPLPMIVGQHPDKFCLLFVNNQISNCLLLRQKCDAAEASYCWQHSWRAVDTIQVDVWYGTSNWKTILSVGLPVRNCFSDKAPLIWGLMGDSSASCVHHLKTYNKKILPTRPSPPSLLTQACLWMSAVSSDRSRIVYSDSVSRPASLLQGSCRHHEQQQEA